MRKGKRTYPASEKLAADALLILQQMGGMLPNEAPCGYDPGTVTREEAAGLVNFYRIVTYKWENGEEISFRIWAGCFDEEFLAPPRGLTSWEIAQIYRQRTNEKDVSYRLYGETRAQEIANAVQKALLLKAFLSTMMGS